jgi:hypothetical protein
VAAPARRSQELSPADIIGLVVLASLMFWPRLIIVGYLIFGRQITNHAYDSWLVILGGFIFLPSTTAAYGAMWGIQSATPSGVEWLVVAFAFLIDLWTWAAFRR